MGLTDEQRISLQELLRGDEYSGSVSDRAQMVLWDADGYSVADVARMLGTSRPTVDRWLDRFEQVGVAGRGDHTPPDVHLGCPRVCVPGSWR